MLIPTSNHSGFTVVELMIALVLTSFVFIVMMTLFLANIQHYNKSLNTNKLNQQLETTLEIMAAEIRRAGYWSNASSNIGVDANNNPFMVAGTTDITLGNSNSCILFTYDHNGTGTLPSISSASDDDRYGFRLLNNAVVGRPPGAGFTCSSSGWENITDTNVIKITALTFTLNNLTYTTGPSARGLKLRSVDISITGSLTNDATVTRTLTQHVKVRNDVFIP